MRSGYIVFGWSQEPVTVDGAACWAIRACVKQKDTQQVIARCRDCSDDEYCVFHAYCGLDELATGQVDACTIPFDCYSDVVTNWIDDVKEINRILKNHKLQYRVSELPRGNAIDCEYAPGTIAKKSVLEVEA